MTKPDDIIAWKIANALIKDAEPSRLANTLLFASAPFIKWMKGAWGGLWVGGTVSLTRDKLIFEPNVLNRMAHAAVSARTLPLARVSEVVDRFGWFTRIVDVRTDDGETLTFRCYGAPAFAEKIRSAVQSCRG